MMTTKVEIFKKSYFVFKWYGSVFSRVLNAGIHLNNSTLELKIERKKKGVDWWLKNA